MLFNDELLEALGGWQQGWREDRDRYAPLAAALESAAASLPERFRTVEASCYRKRFVIKGELVALILRDDRDEGLASWTMDQRFAEQFKGRNRPDAVSAAIFQHYPTDNEVIVSLPALWSSPEFADAATRYRDKGGPNADALFHFRDIQQEVVLKAPLRGSEIIALTGPVSPFDQLCDSAGIPESQRDAVFNAMVAKDIYPGDYLFTSPEGAQRAIARTVQKMQVLIEKTLSKKSLLDPAPSPTV
jgi:hypothetical protein